MRDFEAAYEAYGEFQRSMERYWCLRWLMQERRRDVAGDGAAREPGAVRRLAAGGARAVAARARAGQPGRAGDFADRSAGAHFALRIRRPAGFRAALPAIEAGCRLLRRVILRSDFNSHIQHKVIKRVSYADTPGYSTMRPMGLVPERNVVPLRRRAKHARHAPWRAAVARLDARVAELERHMAAFDRRIAVLGKHARMQVAFAFSVALHAMIIFGVTFTLPDPSKLANQQPLEVCSSTPRRRRGRRRRMRWRRPISTAAATPTERRAKSPLPVPHDAPRRRPS